MCLKRYCLVVMVVITLTFGMRKISLNVVNVELAICRENWFLFTTRRSWKCENDNEIFFISESLSIEWFYDTVFNGFCRDDQIINACQNISSQSALFLRQSIVLISFSFLCSEWDVNGITSTIWCDSARDIWDILISGNLQMWIL